MQAVNFCEEGLGIGDWELGFGDWGLGIEYWGLGIMEQCRGGARYLLI